MKKVINIEGRDIAFASNGFTLFLYKREFKKDFLSEIIKLAGGIEDNKNNDINIEKIDAIFEFCYICAKTANSDLGSFEDWLSSFDEPFTLLNFADEIIELIASNIKTTATSKNKPKKK